MRRGKKILVYFYHKCTKKHAKNECPHKYVEFCGICIENHGTYSCTPSLPGLKDVSQGTEARTKENVKHLCFIIRRLGMSQPFQVFMPYANPQ